MKNPCQINQIWSLSRKFYYLKERRLEKLETSSGKHALAADSNKSQIAKVAAAIEDTRCCRSAQRWP